MRTFIAIEASGGVRSKAVALIERLKAVDAKVTWVRPDQMHWTLKFLGEVDLSLSAEICQRVSEAVAGFEPFELEVRGLGAFPNLERPRTIWLGAGVGAPEVAALRDAVDTALHPLGFPREGRRFMPHLTIGRVRSQRYIRELGQEIQQRAEFQAGVVAVDEIVTVGSVLEPEGPQYDVLGYSPLLAEGD